MSKMWILQTVTIFTNPYCPALIHVSLVKVATQVMDHNGHISRRVYISDINNCILRMTLKYRNDLQSHANFFFFTNITGFTSFTNTLYLYLARIIIIILSLKIYTVISNSIPFRIYIIIGQIPPGPTQPNLA